MLASDGEERASVHFLPKVKSSLVPILSDVVEVVADNRPDNVFCSGLVAVVDEPVGIGDHGNGAESRPITLRTT